MSFDLVLRNVTLADGREGIDIGIRDGLIAALVPGLESAVAEIEAAGALAVPPFVDAHFHLDAALSLGTGGFVNESGTLAEGIALWKRISADMTQEEYRDRALRYCQMAIAKGLLAVRTHVDITDERLRAAEALAEVKRLVAPYLDLQLVAFPQMGFFCRPTMADSVRRALDLGFDAVGGIPHLEPTVELGRASITALCEIAAERGVAVDMHCDENDDPSSRMIETLVWETRRLGLGGRVAASHLTSMGSMDDFYANRLIGMIAEAEVRVIVNPAVNLHLQGRFHGYPKRRGLARVAELMHAGVPVAMAQDCVLDPWYPLGQADLLDIAWLGAHACHLTDPAGLRACFAAVTDVPAEILGLGQRKFAPGKPASFVLLDARDPVEAIRTRPVRTAVIRNGRVLARTEPARPVLDLSELAV